MSDKKSRGHVSCDFCLRSRIYEYFDGRDAIVSALCQRHVTRVRTLVDHAFVELQHAPIETAVGLFVDALFALHAHRPALQLTLHHEFPRRLGLQPFIDSDQYIEAKLVDWLAERDPTADRADLATRAFVAIRAGRAVTIHAFAEDFPEERKACVRVAIKALLVGALERLP